LNIVKFFARYPLLGLAIFASLLAAACYPVRLEADWPGIATLGDQKAIVLAYNDRVVMIDPVDGLPIQLRNADGEVRLDAEGKPRIWEFRGEDGQAAQFYSAPVLLDETTLLVSTYKPADNRIFEVNLPTARLDGAGAAVPGHVVADVVRNDDLVFVGLSERNLVAYDAADLTQRWQVDTQHGIWSHPLFVDDVMYFTSLDHFLYAVNPDNGDVLWKLDLQGAAPGAPVYYEGRLYVGTFARKVFEISTEGSIVSEYSTADWVWGSPTIVDDVLYVGDMGGHLYALNVGSSGLSERWTVKVAERAIRATPLVTDDYIIVGSRDHKIYWLNRGNGRPVTDVDGPRVRSLNGEILSDLLLIEPSNQVNIREPYVIVSSVANDNLLAAFTLSKGERVWTYGR
jgi:outer membrane protein assembly factor BamB